MLKATFLGAEGGPREKQLKNKCTCVGQWMRGCYLENLINKHLSFILVWALSSNGNHKEIWWKTSD